MASGLKIPLCPACQVKLTRPAEKPMQHLSFLTRVLWVLFLWFGEQHLIERLWPDEKPKAHWTFDKPLKLVRLFLSRKKMPCALIFLQLRCRKFKANSFSCWMCDIEVQLLHNRILLRKVENQSLAELLGKVNCCWTLDKLSTILKHRWLHVSSTQ